MKQSETLWVRAKKFGLVCLFLFSISTGCKDFLPEPENRVETNPEYLFDLFWRDVNLTYPFFPLDGVDWQQTYATYRPRVTATTPPDSLFLIFTQMMAPLLDGHASLQNSQGRVWTNPEKSAFPNDFSLSVVISRYLKPTDTTGLRRRNVFVSSLNTPQPVLYAWIPTFTREGIGRSLDSAIRAQGGLQGLQAVVIDVRNNGGGLLKESEEVAGLFTQSRTLYGTTLYRNGPLPDNYADPEENFFEPFRGLGFVGKPVFVLTNRYSASASERLRLMLGTRPNTTVIGDTTYGALSPIIPRTLPNGWQYVLTGSVFRDRDGTLWERRGIPPDIRVTSSRFEMNRGTDRVLDAVIARLP